MLILMYVLSNEERFTAKISNHLQLIFQIINSYVIFILNTSVSKELSIRIKGPSFIFLLYLPENTFIKVHFILRIVYDMQFLKFYP